ncbi:DsrE family protein [Chromohalobacter sarecensis]|uniref:DsrE family protein n=1 Tax=Chromohalobacter sarecensis TaxID=245294 RepID=A0ABV9CW27_9GAMM|nr:DsrE family protein [Chromohalobacter sarecensis]MCK0715529.1 DsrE family protein [Chromohalobacter sarecensis]
MTTGWDNWISRQPPSATPAPIDDAPLAGQEEAQWLPLAHGTYRALFQWTTPSAQGAMANAGLLRAVRAVNLFAAADVPVERRHMIVLVSGAATPCLLEDTAYARHYGLPADSNNPNRVLIEALQREGVGVMVCLQAWHGQGFARDALLADIELAQSSMTVGIALQNAGFALVAV